MPSVLITGGGKRLGRALAIEFAKKNWDVAFIYYQSQKQAEETQKQLTESGVRCSIARADFRKKVEIESAFSRIFDEFGVPDVLINNAGIFPNSLKLEEIREQVWDDTLNINLKAYFLCSQYYAKFASSGSRIINIGSLGALEIWAHRIPYNVSKAGVVQLTKALARELAPDISVNCINPGTVIIPGEMVSHDLNLIDAGKIPMKRFADISDIFDAVHFFATCSSYITGTFLNVDGAYSCVR